MIFNLREKNTRKVALSNEFVYTYVCLFVCFCFVGALAGKIILSMILAKLFITISFDGVYLYTVELFQTSVRYLYYTVHIIKGLRYIFPVLCLYTLNGHPWI